MQPVPNVQPAGPTKPLRDPSQEQSLPLQQYNLNVKPVPDPDAQRKDRATRGTAPELVDPKDRTARLSSFQSGWAFAPIVWPDKTKALTAQPAVITEPARTEQQHQERDSSGWHAVRP
jgi:hypothetical protein